MNKQKGVFVGKLLLLALFTLAVSGCATAQYEKLAVNIEIDKPPGIKVFNVAVRSQDSKTIITGKLHKKSHRRTAIPGHVDILVLSPEGKLLYEVYTKFHRKTRKPRNSTFSAELPMIVSEGSTIRIKHHRTAKHEKC